MSTAKDDSESVVPKSNRPVRKILESEMLEAMYDAATEEILSSDYLFRSKVRDKVSGEFIEPTTTTLKDILKGVLNEARINQMDRKNIYVFGNDIFIFLKVLHALRNDKGDRPIADRGETFKRVSRSTEPDPPEFDDYGNPVIYYLHGFKVELILNLPDFV